MHRAAKETPESGVGGNASPGGGDKAGARPAATFLQQRLLSLDAYRGMIMIALAFHGFGLAGLSANMLKVNPESSPWKAVAYQFNHVEWAGGGFWDMIQPSFMFMVGVSMPYSYAGRKNRGETWGRSLLHAIVRSLVLIGLGIFLISNSTATTNWSLMNVLTQIGLGYMFLFLLWGRPLPAQSAAAAVILAATWALYFLYPNAGVSLETGSPEVGVTAEWAAEHLAQIAPAWHKNANIGHAIDLHLLNWLPTVEPFVFNRGGYQTINFLPSLATMLFGLMAGELLRSERSAGRKWLLLIAAGIAALGIGAALHYAGIIPLVKRIWTPSWAIYSTGWCLLMLAMLYGIIDVLGFRRWAFPLVVVGVNSIAMYVMGGLLTGWTAKTLQTHLGEKLFLVFDKLQPGLGEIYEPFVRDTLIGLCFWLVCLWMYRQKIFVRI
ncbi:MAG: acyltransferase family protein [Pirellulales bacterium]